MYDATLALVTSATATGQSANSADITGLANSTAYTYTVIATGDNSTYYDSSASSPTSVTTDIPTGLNANTTTNLLVSGKTITANQTGTIEIFNLQGASIFQAASVTKVTTNLPSGLYVVRFTNANGLTTVKKVSIR